MRALMVSSLTSRSLAAAQASRRVFSPAAHAPRARRSSTSQAARASASAADACASRSCRSALITSRLKRGPQD